MHHDGRIYIELRYDVDTCDAVIVHFRDRGILPTEVKSWEYILESTTLGDDPQQELKTLLNTLWIAVYDDK